MKLTHPFQGIEPQHAGLRKNRMEALLSAWRPAPGWLRPDGESFVPVAVGDAVLTGDEWQTWLAILRAAAPLPPRTCLAGLQAHAELADTTVDALEASGAVMLVG